nr:hypothetical protein CFP56_07880 [Quercus suber]
MSGIARPMICDLHELLLLLHDAHGQRTIDAVSTSKLDPGTFPVHTVHTPVVSRLRAQILMRRNRGFGHMLLPARSYRPLPTSESALLLSSTTTVNRGPVVPLLAPRFRDLLPRSSGACWSARSIGRGSSVRPLFVEHYCCETCIC